MNKFSCQHTKKIAVFYFDIKISTVSINKKTFQISYCFSKINETEEKEKVLDFTELYSIIFNLLKILRLHLKKSPPSRWFIVHEHAVVDLINTTVFGVLVKIFN